MLCPRIIRLKVRPRQEQPPGILRTGENKERCEMDKRQKQHSSSQRQDRFSRLRSVFLSQYAEFVAAVRFLTVLPVPGSTQVFDKYEVTPRLVIVCVYCCSNLRFSPV